MGKNFKNIRFKRSDEQELSFDCLNEIDNLHSNQFRRLEESDIKRILESEEQIKQKRSVYRNQKNLKSAPPFVQHADSDLIYIPIVFHQFINNGPSHRPDLYQCDTCEAPLCIDGWWMEEGEYEACLNKLESMYNSYDPEIQEFTSDRIHSSGYSIEFYQAVVDRLNGFMSGTATALGSNYEGNAINNVDHGTDSKIRFFIASHLPAKFFKEFLVSRRDVHTNSPNTDPPGGWEDTLGFSIVDDSYVAQIKDHFGLPYLEQGLNGESSFYYTNDMLDTISADALLNFENASAAYDSLVTATMASESVTEAEAIELVVNSDEVKELERAAYINQLQGLVSCGPSGAVLTYDINAYDFCKLTQMHSVDSEEYVNCTELAACNSESCPQKVPFAQMLGVDPDPPILMESYVEQVSRLGHMLPTLNVWTTHYDMGISTRYSGYGPMPASDRQGNLYMSENITDSRFKHSVDKYAQVLLHEFGHSSGMPHTFQGGMVKNLVKEEGDYLSPSFSVPLSAEDTIANNGNDFIEPSESDARYIEAIYKAAQTLPNAANDCDAIGGDISKKIGFDVINVDGVATKDVSSFNTYGWDGDNVNIKARQRIISHLWNTGVFWANIDPNQNNKLVFNRVLDKTSSIDIFNSLYNVDGEVSPNSLSTNTISSELTYLVLAPDATLTPENVDREYELVLYDSAVDSSTHSDVFRDKAENRKLKLNFFIYEIELTLVTQINGVIYETTISSSDLVVDGDYASYTAILPSNPTDLEYISLKWYTVYIPTKRDENLIGTSGLVSADFEYKYRPIATLDRMPFCVLDGNGDATDVFDEFWHINLNWIDEDYPPYPDNWLTSKIYNEFDDNGNSLCPCLYATQHYSSNVGISDMHSENYPIGFSTFTPNSWEITSPEGDYVVSQTDNWTEFMDVFSQDSRWVDYFLLGHFFNGSSSLVSMLDYPSNNMYTRTGILSLNKNTRLMKFGLWENNHPPYNYGGMGHAPIFGNYGYSTFSTLPRFFQYNLTAATEDINLDNIYLTFSSIDNLQPDIPRMWQRDQAYIGTESEGEQYTELFQKLSIGDTDPTLDTYNPYRIAELDLMAYPKSRSLFIDEVDSDIVLQYNPITGQTFNRDSININWFYNAMDYSGKPHSGISGRWGTCVENNTVTMPDGGKVNKRRTLFSPEGIFRIDSNIEVGLGKWGGITYFGNVIKDLDISGPPIQGLLVEIEDYIVNYEVQEFGCTDPTAPNYKPDAVYDDDSCMTPFVDCDLPTEYIEVCIDSDVTTCNPVDDNILNTFLTPTDDFSQLVYTEEYPQIDGCTGGGVVYIKNCPTCILGNSACEYGVLEITGCAVGLGLSPQETADAVGSENYTLVCPNKNYVVSANLYTSGGLYYTSDSRSYSGVYCFREDGIIYSGTLKNPGERLYSIEDLKTKPLPPLEFEAKNFDKIKTNIENICTFVNL